MSLAHPQHMNISLIAFSPSQGMGGRVFALFVIAILAPPRSASDLAIDKSYNHLSEQALSIDVGIEQVEG